MGYSTSSTWEMQTTSRTAIWTCVSIALGLALRFEALVVEDMEAVFAGGYDVEAAGAAQVGQAELDAAPHTDPCRPVGDYLFAEPLAVPLKVVESEVVELAGVVAAVGAEALAGDQLGLTVAVDVGPDEVVVLGIEGVDRVLDPVRVPSALRFCSYQSRP